MKIEYRLRQKYDGTEMEEYEVVKVIDDIKEDEDTDEIYTRVVTIPEEYNGKPVTSIGKRAFNGLWCNWIILPKSIGLIKEFAFEDCPNLTAIIIKSRRIEFDQYAFMGREFVTIRFEGDEKWKCFT